MKKKKTENNRTGLDWNIIEVYQQYYLWKK